MSKYKAKLATQKYVEEKIGELALVVSSPDEAVDEGVYKVIDGAGSYILITQTVGEGISPIRQSKITADGVIYSREFDIFESPFPEFTQSTVSQNEMALFEIMVDSQFAAIEEQIEKQRIVTSAEGESIALPDSDDAQLRGLKVMGKTEQFKTNGYQLFDASRIPELESSGAKLTNNGDGSLTISGSGSTTGSFQTAYEYSHEETVAMFKAGTVYIKGDAITYPPISLQKRWIKDGETNYSATSVAAINGTKSLTITEDDLNDPTMHIRFVFYASSGKEITSGTIKPMVYQDGDGTWEPFTGGKPSPGINNVKSKNLFKLPKDINIVNYGITITGNAGESFVTINGTCDNTQDSSITFVASGDNSLLIKSDKKYTASVRGLHKVTSSTDRILINGRKTEGGIYVMANHIMTDKPVTFPSETFPTIGADVLVNIMLIFSPGTTYDNEKVYIQIEEGETATPWMSYFEPYTESYPQPLESVGDDGSVDVKVYRKNILPYPYNSTSLTRNGITFTDNEDGSVSVIGTATDNVTFYLIRNATLPNGAYTLMGGATGSIKRANGTTDYILTTKPTFTMADGDTINYLAISVLKGATDNTTYYPMLCHSNITDTTWEAPMTPQTLTISTPNGLPGVPVSSNGNYTDASGQQWVCDEKDYDRGVYAERVYKYIYIGDGKPIVYAPRSNDIIYCRINPPKSLVVHSRLSNFFTPTKIWGDVTSKPYVIYNSKEVIYFSIKAEDLGLNGTEKETEIRAIANDWLAKTFSADNPLIIYCGYVEPDETPLSEAEINAYKALHAYYPYTSIHNSDNAHMAVDYVADNKNYVDNQIKKEIAELKALILEV